MRALDVARPDLTSFVPVGEVVASTARSYGDKAALICDTTVVTWRELGTRIDRAAARLQTAGVGVGANVALLSPTTVEGVIGFLASIRAGACIVPLPTSATPGQLHVMLDDCKAQAVLAAPPHHALADSALQRNVAHRFSLGPATTTWGALENGTKVQFVAPAIGPDTPFNIIYSSGTTGSPKGIVQDHSVRWYQNVPPVDAKPEDGAVILVSTPLSSNTTIGGGLLRGLCTGGALVLMPKFDAGLFLSLCMAHGVTQASLVPVQCQRLLAHPDFDRTDLSRVALRCTGAPASIALKRELIERWRGPIADSYGFTELAIGCVLDLRAFPEKLHTIGRPRPGVDMRIVGKDGREVLTGEAGELAGRAATMMNGYWNQPDATQALIWRDAEGRGFYRSSDVAMIDPDGFITLLGRTRDMIISGGLNIYPADLEGVLSSHPQVAEAVVIGIPSPEWGETPLGLVAVRESATITPDALRAWANAQLGRTQKLSALEFRAEFPRNELGKILKRELRAPFWAAAH